MEKKQLPMFVFLLMLIVTTSFKFLPKEVVRNDFKKIYDKYNVQGSFVIYNKNKDEYTYYNKEQTIRPFTPASTFKICNTLISLNSKVIDDEDVVIKWDGKQRQNPAWNHDTDMRDAFKNSTVWFYQELARRVGEKRMKAYLEKANYGNHDISGGIDAFWLTGGLRITPQQQIDFLRKLQSDKLPFSKSSMDILRDIMIVDNKQEYIIRAKTGSGKQDGVYIGWYVGYVTTKDNIFYFVNCIQTKEKNDNFNNARIEISNIILDEIGAFK
ncbi:class D beta-lactamase [Pedobacter agri]|uniref:class D beta-lactamase n=1 Tax=Pedobacter agri TaxID=454586 RepID=UPI002785E730|nr:class D beta-lactamase [Pedobacter agri]MDQ1142714.1 beta-lactamase class D [Pedobacter agri]